VLRPEVVDVGAFVIELEPMLRRLLGGDVDLEIHRPSRTAQVRADPGHLQQVLFNLVSNARDAMPDGGRVSISVARMSVPASLAGDVSIAPGAYVRVSVADTGVGMDEETIPRVFEPFFTTKEVGKGTGLGLAMIHGIVRQSGGAIDFETHRSSGTTFRILLPEVVDRKVARSAPARPLLRSGDGVRVLVVEDEVIVRDLTRMTLAANGFAVVEAANGALALEALESTSFDLVISDVVMPGLGGAALAEAMAARAQVLPIIFMSGQLKDDRFDPAHPFLLKPFTPSQLLATVRSTLEARGGSQSPTASDAVSS
jgi:CheY-like chemotaxis protein